MFSFLIASLGLGLLCDCESYSLLVVRNNALLPFKYPLSSSWPGRMVHLCVCVHGCISGNIRDVWGNSWTDKHRLKHYSTSKHIHIHEFWSNLHICASHVWSIDPSIFACSRLVNNMILVGFTCTTEWCFALIIEGQKEKWAWEMVKECSMRQDENRAKGMNGASRKEEERQEKKKGHLWGPGSWRFFSLVV